VPCTATTDLPVAADTSAISFESFAQMFSMKNFLLGSMVFWLYGLQYERIAGAGASAIRLGIGIYLRPVQQPNRPH
jgi:hypothetical protein